MKINYSVYNFRSFVSAQNLILQIEGVWRQRTKGNICTWERKRDVDEVSVRFSRLGACVCRVVSAASPDEGWPVPVLTYHAIKTPGAWGVTLRKFLKFTIDNGNQLHPLAAITMEKGTPLLIGISCSRWAVPYYYTLNPELLEAT